MKESFRYVNNHDMRRMDAWDKVTGKAMYTGDIKMFGMLYAKSVFSKYGHAKILKVDVSEALKYPGVVDVITGADVPGMKTFGENVQDEYAIAFDKVRQYGDAVAVVAAESEEIAEEAAKLVKVEYEELPGLYSPEAAMNSDIAVTDLYPDNIYCEYKASFGDVEVGFKESDIIMERRYKTQWQEHAYTEPEAVIAYCEPRDGAITVWGCLQNLFMARESVAKCLGLPFSKVTIRQAVIGGSFGGKQETTVALAVRVAVLAQRTGRPVRIVLTREESFRETMKRHPFDMKIKIGCTKDGKLKAMQGDFISDAGCYVNKSKGIMGKAVCLGMGPYKNANTLFVGHPIMTNNIHTGSYQGFGNPQGTYARESAMTEMAELLGLSPYQFRKMNVLHTGDFSGTGQKMDWCRMGAEDVLDAVAKEIDFENKYWKYKKENAENNSDIKRGVGISLTLHGNSTGTIIPDEGRVYLVCEEDGSVTVHIGLTEIGQGLYTTMRILTAECLCCDIDDIRIMDADTNGSPLTGAALASRGTYLGGHAIRDAAKQIHATMRAVLSQKYRLPDNQIEFKDGMVQVGNETITFKQACKITYDMGKAPCAVGTYKTPPLTWDGKTGTGEPFYMYTFSATAVELEVDMATGKTNVIRSCAAHDVGRAINYQGAVGQVLGGIINAQGWALTEDINSKDGVIRNLNYDNYIIPTSMDIGDVTAIIVENPDPRGAFGARSLGEPAFDPCAPAFIAAVNMAMGGKKHVRNLPANLEAVYFCKEDE